MTARAQWIALAFCLAFASRPGLATEAAAQTTPADGLMPRQEGPEISFVEEFAFDGGVAEWRALPVDRILEATDSTPQVLLWIGQVEEGLVVAAELRSGGAGHPAPPLFVRLAGPSEPDLPPIGWGHQFGFEVLADSASCAEVPDGSAACLGWYRRQVAQRERLPALFGRTWRLDLAEGDAAPVEVGATAAFAALVEPERLAPLAPRGQARALTRDIHGTGGVGVELLIPWSSFPPVRAPDLDAVRIEVEWNAEPRAPTSRVAGGRPPATPRFATPGLGPPRPLARPLSHHVTPCRAGLRGVLVRGSADQRPRVTTEAAVVYMIPEPSGDLRRLIILDNHVEGYQYTPSPAALSPEAFETSYEVLDLGGGLRLCTPSLALANDRGRLSPEDWTSTGEGDPWDLFADLRDLEVRPLGDGSFLALSGPRVFWSYYGSGQCGACPRVSVEFFHLDPVSGAVRTVLRHLNVAEPEARDVEIEVAPDWSAVTVFRSQTLWDAEPNETRWRATRYCRGPAANGPPTFEVCAEEEDVSEPPVNLRGRYADR